MNKSPFIKSITLTLLSMLCVFPARTSWVYGLCLIYVQGRTEGLVEAADWLLLLKNVNFRIPQHCDPCFGEIS